MSLRFHFGRVLIHSVEVAGVTTSLNPCVAQVPQSAPAVTLTQATPAYVTFRSCAPIPKGSPLGLVSLGLYLGRAVMRSVEVARVSSRLTPSFSLSRMLLRRAYFPGVARLIPKVPWV